jgi:hypothetical protein
LANPAVEVIRLRNEEDGSGLLPWLRRKNFMGREISIDTYFKERGTKTRDEAVFSAKTLPAVRPFLRSSFLRLPRTVNPFRTASEGNLDPSSRKSMSDGLHG